MNYIKKIIFIIALSFSVIIAREFIALYNDLKEIDLYLGYSFLIALAIILVYFLAIPFAKILLLPKTIPPAKKPEDVDDVITKRVKRLRNNKLLKDSEISSIKDEKEYYEAATDKLKNIVEDRRKFYVNNVMLSTGLSQNGFLDAIIILSACINLIKEIFIIYNGRFYGKDFFNILGKIYTAMAIGGSEIAEKSTEELLSLFASEGFKKIPFFNTILGSISDGFINAILVTRISLIAENYCTMTLVESDKELNPGFASIMKSVKRNSGEILSIMKESILKIGKGKDETEKGSAIESIKRVFDDVKQKINFDETKEKLKSFSLGGIKNIFS